MNHYYSKLYEIKVGVSQSSIFVGVILYIIFTSNIFLAREVTMTTFGDDTTVLFSNQDPTKEFSGLQIHLSKLWQ